MLSCSKPGSAEDHQRLSELLLIVLIQILDDFIHAVLPCFPEVLQIRSFRIYINTTMSVEEVLYTTVSWGPGMAWGSQILR